MCTITHESATGKELGEQPRLIVPLVGELVNIQ